MAQVALSREEATINQLKTRFPEAIKETKVDRALRVTVGFDSARLIEIAKFMRDDLGFDHVKVLPAWIILRTRRLSFYILRRPFQNPIFKTSSSFSRPNCLVTTQ